MNSNIFSVSRNLLLLTLITGSILSFITNVTGINVKYFDDIAIVILFFFVLLSKNRLSIEFLRWPLIFLLISLFSLILNFENFSLKDYSIQLKNYLLPCLIYLVTAVIYSEKAYKKYLNYYIYFSFILLFIGISEYILDRHFYVVYGVFGNPSSINPFRSYSLVGSPVDFAFFLIFPIIYSFLYYQKKYLSLLFGIGILLTQSLGVITLILINLIALVYTKIISIKKFLFFLIIGLILIVNYSGLTNRFISKQNTILDYNQLDQSSRYDFYLQSGKIIKDNFFLGVGVGNFGGWASNKDNLVYQKYGFSFNNLNSIDLFYPHLMGETGIFGLISFLMIYLSIIFKNLNYIKTYKKTKNQYGFILAGTVFLYGISLLFSGFWSMLLETNFATIPFFFVAAFSMCYNSSVTKKENENLQKKI